MSKDSLSSNFFSAMCESQPSNGSIKSKPWFSSANGDHNQPRTKTQKPVLSWRAVNGREENTSTNWRDRSQPSNTTSVFSTWRGGTRKEESNGGAFKRNDAFVKVKPKSTEMSVKSFGKPQSKFGTFNLVLDDSAASELSADMRTVFSESRSKFGSNSSIALASSVSSELSGGNYKNFDISRSQFGSSSNLVLSTPSGLSEYAHKTFGQCRKILGSNWSVASETTATNDHSISRRAPNDCGNYPRRGKRIQPESEHFQSSPKLCLKYLKLLLQKEVHEIVCEVTISKSPIDAYLEKSPLEPDWLILILNIVAKVCVSDYEGSCSDLLYKLCKSQFFDTLSYYLGDVCMETQQDTIEKLPAFVLNLCEFYSSLLDAWPMIAVEKDLKKLLAKTKVAVNDISNHLGAQIDANISSKLEALIDRFDECKEMFKEKKLAEKRKRSKAEKLADCAPTDNFRHLSLYPTKDDLFQTQHGFIRPNKVKGAYQNVEHYLDVQFRLLREDFIDSLRSGIQKYLASKSESRRKYKFDSVRVYPDTILKNWQRRNNLEVGVTLKFDPNLKFAPTYDWAQSKRFMHGSLLLLTADDFDTFICAKVLERDIHCLKAGCVLAVLVKNTSDIYKMLTKPFTMVESELFFEPYFLILQTLQNLCDYSFPMTKYIVRGQSETECPSYPPKSVLRRMHFFECDDLFDLDVRDHIPKDEDSLKLDEYQMEAYEAGLSRNFCVIQGPPGTGKTFVGLKIVQYLLDKCIYNEYKLPILVICLTNHALDQFLEHIINFTSRIVRVGGQSQNENLIDYNLRALRSKVFHGHKSKYEKKSPYFHSISFQIKKEIALLNGYIEFTQKIKTDIATSVGILFTALLRNVVQPNYLTVVEDDETLLQWLLEDNECETFLENDFVKFSFLYETDIVDDDDTKPVVIKNNQHKTLSIFTACTSPLFSSYSITLEELKKELECINEEYNTLLESEVSLLEQGYDSKLIYFEKAYLKNTIKHRTREYRKLKANLENSVEKRETKIPVTLHQDPRKVPSRLRWLIYWSWLSDLQEKLSFKITILEARRRAKMIQYEEYKMLEDLSIMSEAHIVGMTTTGAAKQKNLLNLLKPAIVIVEEAAEVLEAHIVAALTKSCRHLILIGDHKQLRPTSAVYELSKHYHIDVSLFERMINNGMHCPMLKTQHRMRPEISSLISPLIYPDLINHESVFSLDPVKGVKKNMFFIEHNMPETATDDEMSKGNKHEAEFVVKLAGYFIQQGYDAEKITLLTFYAGQMFQIRNLLKRNYLNEVKCFVVDKYQGEENDIILLSLVRSNEDGNIGFLSVENRVCVALSRARIGLFMIGNMDCLANKQLWQKLRDILKKNDAIDKKLPLYCDRHDKITPVSEARDFHLVSGGGCEARCNMEMECGHFCPKICHPVLGEHKSVYCEEPCKKLCPSNHPCNKLCKEACGRCKHLIEKLLPCQHVAKIFCHIDEAKYLCTELVDDVPLPCGHVVIRKCHQKFEEVQCRSRCGKQLNCGHTCTRLCHNEDDPDHAACQERCEKYYEGCKKAHLCEKLCYKECGKCPFEEDVNLSCGHKLSVPCYTDLTSVKCTNPCNKICSECNLNCMNPCGENCHPCINKVRKIIPTCGHEMIMNCSDEPNQIFCQQNCKLMAPCGHKCQLKCGETCDSRGCKEWITFADRKPICGHDYIYILCSERKEVWQKAPEIFSTNCREPCNVILECGDVCGGTCGQCFQGRLHQKCKKLCGKTFICGHRCKLPCQKLCPPCNEPCSFRCPHSKCKEKCGIPCSTCKKPCEWKCKHSKCSRKCGDICNRQPCFKPCELKLPCGHDCIGFCGEPCPQQCRFCNPEVTDIIFGYENVPDARFVLMVDCDHVIESRAIDQYFSSTFGNGEILLRGCPLCGTPITKTLRLMNFIKRIYQQIAEVNTKTFENLRSFDSKKMLRDWKTKLPEQCSNIKLFYDFVQFCITKVSDHCKKHVISSEILSNMIYFYQVCQALISEGQVTNEFFKAHIILYFEKLISRMKETNFNVNRQLMLDFNVELRRYHLMIDYQFLTSSNLFHNGTVEVTNIHANIKKILFGSTKFLDTDEAEIKLLFEKLITHTTNSSLWSGQRSKLARKKVLPNIFDELKAGCWFQCLNGHYYCIDGNEMQKKTANCPECVRRGTSEVRRSSRKKKWRARR